MQKAKRTLVWHWVFSLSYMWLVKSVYGFYLV